MSRPLRIEYAGALYHVTSRGNARAAIYLDELDFSLFIEVLASVCELSSQNTNTRQKPRYGNINSF